jgi:hypothetical protein
MARSIPAISREQAVAYRLDAQGLNERAEAERLAGVAAAVWVQNTPPGSAGQALAARLDGIRERDVIHALEDDKTLLQAFGARAAPHVCATADAPTYLLGLRPDDEGALREFLQGAQPALDAVRIAASELVRLTRQAVTDILDGTALVKDDLGHAAGRAIIDHLPGSLRQAWTSPSTYAQDQFLGESLVRFALPVLSLQGVLCHGDRQGRSPLLYRTDQWLGADPFRDISPARARAELVRRYLRCYGPSTPEQLAAWGGIGLQQAQAAWAQVRAELREVTFMDATAWLLRADADRPAQAPRPAGVRLLPPRDPYLQTRDRTTLLADQSLHRRVWRATGAPGAVLVDGHLRATWRPRAKGRVLEVRIEPLDELPSPAIDLVHEEAERLAAFRERALGTVTGL